MNKTDKTDDRRGGFYWLDEKPYVSVTTVLKVLDKPAIRYWFGKEVYLAMVVNPTLTEGEALAAPYKTSGKAQERGKTVHSIVEAYKTTGAKIEGIPEAFVGYAKAFYSWAADNNVKVLESEKTVVSQKHMFAGTLDLLVHTGQKRLLVDIKTGKDIYPEAALQLSAYRQALQENNEPVDAMGVVLLREDGTYKFEEQTPVFEIFLSVKHIWEWQNAELCGKVVYETK